MSEVYKPSEDTFLLAEVLKHEQLAEKDVLEIGCGSGFLTAVTAERGANVTAIDINSAAIDATKKLLVNRKLTAHVFLSDLFENVQGKFDLILFNSPYLPENEEDKLAGKDIRYSGGHTGRKVIEKFIVQSKKHLKIGGKILLLISSLTDERKVIEFFEGRGFICRPIANKKIEWEELLVLEALVHL